MALKVRQFTIRYWKEDEGGYGGQCIELPAAISQGETLDELKANVTEAIELALEVNEAKSKKDKKMIIDIPAN
jgi:predicted RNase H-like HicB family nuclease